MAYLNLADELGISERARNQFFSDTISHPMGSKFGRICDNNGLWHAPIELVSMVIDYDELREARRNAKQAFWLSILAIVISLVTLVVAVVRV